MRIGITQPSQPCNGRPLLLKDFGQDTDLPLLVVMWASTSARRRTLIENGSVTATRAGGDAPERLSSTSIQ